MILWSFNLHNAILTGTFYLLRFSRKFQESRNSRKKHYLKLNKIFWYINYLIICEHCLTLFFRKLNEKITTTDWIHRLEGNSIIFKYFWHTYLPKLSQLKWRLKIFQNTTWKSVQFSALLTFLSFNLWQLSVIFLILRIHNFFGN